MLLNPLPTEMIRKRAPRKAPGFRQTLGMHVCEHSVCVWGAVNQNFNFSIFLYSRIVLLESRYSCTRLQHISLEAAGRMGRIVPGFKSKLCYLLALTCWTT